MTQMHSGSKNTLLFWMALALGLLWLSNACGPVQLPAFRVLTQTPPQLPAHRGRQALGERLFLDTRFAEYFATHMTGVNQPLVTGDPVVTEVQTTSGMLPGPFAGQSINCRSVIS